MRAISIVPVSTADIDVAVRLLEAQLLEHDIYTAEQAIRAVVEAVTRDNRHGFMLLGWSENRPVGIAYAAAHLSAEHGGLIGWLEELYVVPDFRGCGVGSSLLSTVVSRAGESNWRGIELEVVAGHERAAALYARHGFGALNRKRYVRMLA
ncbi:MAG TPA: GNAT family N-acetyltransferase [Chthoniobacterales bacterium]|nr:GNAT family N-acetyltransferase [Chthoniobacterales bacterium]